MVEPMETECITVPDTGKAKEQSEETKNKNAESLKNSGNEFYKQRKYQEALNMYSEAIRLIPSNAAYYGNRSATYMMLHKFNDALEDAKTSTQIDREFTKGYLREGKCFIALGKPFAAMQCLDKALVIDPYNSSVLKERETATRLRSFETEAQRHFVNQDFRRAEYCIKQCLIEASTAHSYKLFRAECLAYQGSYTDASEIANSVLQVDRQNSDAIFVRGLCLYYEDQVEKAQNHFRQVLRFNPDHNKSKEAFKMSKQLILKKEKGNEAFKSYNYEAAIQLYTQALEIDPHNKFTNAKLYNNRATCNAKLNKLDAVIADCNSAIGLDSSYTKAFQRRAKAYTDTEQYEEALRDYESANKLDPSRENSQAVKQAKLELKKSKRKDYYKILGVGKDASDDELKRAYRRRAMAHHPDRHSHDTPEKQLEEEKVFKDVGEAYAVLSDPRKKMRYDSGADIDEMEGGAGFADASNLFEMFFGGGQGGDFHFASHGGHGGHGGHGHGGRGPGGQQGFPGNFFQF